MLRELHISNLAVIEDAVVELHPGLNCFTGQTGAGKSLVLGAFELLLGLRSTPASELLRPGAEEARVSGLFELRDAQAARAVAAAADQSLAADEPLLITRKFFASGRSSVTVNGQPATGAMVRAIGQLLVDVHGQHDHQYLLKPANQLLILDAFGRCEELRGRFAQDYAELRDLRQRREELTAGADLARQQLELYEFQAREIDAADLRPGEYAELQARHARLGNLQRIKKEAGAAHAALHESDGAIVERLQMVAHILGELALVDEQIRNVGEQVRAATLSLQDAAFELGRYVERLELDPAELAEVEDRLNALNRLAAKYGSPQVSRRREPVRTAGGNAAPGQATATGTDPLAPVLAYRDHLEQELTRLRGQGQDLSQIDGRMAELSASLATLGRQLTASRQAAARKLRPLVEKELLDLGMAEAEFSVALAPWDQPAAEEPESERAAVPAGPTGLDQVEMLVRTNPGQPARPLRKIASGGELSRIMLALKSILAQSDRVSVLVFDEIDANVGGRMGTVIGAKLRRLAGKGGQQVLCITHLPQIAAYADRHLHIAKAVTGKGRDRETRTTVAALSGEERIGELAEMLAGKEASATSRKQAREMLQAAGTPSPA